MIVIEKDLRLIDELNKNLVLKSKLSMKII